MSAAKGPQASSGALLGGITLVGAAAGYAALAFTYRNFGSAAGARRYAAGNAEMRFSENITREWEALRSKARADRRGSERRRSQEEFDSHDKWKQDFESFKTRAENARHDFETRYSTEVGDLDKWAFDELRISSANRHGLTLSEVKKAYHARAKETHPDSGGDTKTFERVGLAYEALQKRVVKHEA